jgi:hypothetical protein
MLPFNLLNLRIVPPGAAAKKRKGRVLVGRI